MTTEPEVTYEPPAPFPEAGYVVFGVPDVPFSSVRLPLVWDINEMNVLIASAMETAKLVREAYQETFPPPQWETQSQARPAQPQQAPQQASQRAPQGQQQVGQRETRADRFPLLEGWECDRCGGPVGRRLKTGRMTDDAAVCLGNCKDGNYVHSLGWVNG